MCHSVRSEIVTRKLLSCVVGAARVAGAGVAAAGVYVPPAAGFLVGVHVGAGASLSHAGVSDEAAVAGLKPSDEAPVAGLKPASLPLTAPAVDAKWFMKPSPAALSGVASAGASLVLGDAAAAL